MASSAVGLIASAASASSAAFFVVVVFERHARHQFVRLVELRIDFERLLGRFIGLGVEVVGIDFGQPEVGLRVLRIERQRFLVKLCRFVAD